MESATIDPHSHKVHTKLYKIPKFGVNRSNRPFRNSSGNWGEFQILTNR